MNPALRRQPKLVHERERANAVLQEIIEGLRRQPYHLPCKLFYDEAGARLFDEITRTNAYYPTRAETAILRAHAHEIADWVGPLARVVELGSGSGMKTRILLDALHMPERYLPIDVSREQLLRYAATLRADRPSLNVEPLCLDYTQPFTLPRATASARRTVVFFPGSTIGNFSPTEALRFLRRLRHIGGRGGALIIGVDLRKDARIINRAYNDPEGITARFNLNILAHVNALTGADFDPANFEHHAFYDEARGRIEMHLRSRMDHIVYLRPRPDSTLPVPFSAGDSILTEYSYKYDVDEFTNLAGRAGYRPSRVLLDSENLFSVHLLTAH